jgi:hypothetical protein
MPPRQNYSLKWQGTLLLPRDGTVLSSVQPPITSNLHLRPMHSSTSIIITHCAVRAVCVVYIIDISKVIPMALCFTTYRHFEITRLKNNKVNLKVF